MSTAYTFHPTIAGARARRVSSFKPKFADASRHYAKALATIFVICAAAVTVVTALLLIRIDNPLATDRRCALSANSHNSLLRPGLHPLAVARDWHTDGLPVLRAPTSADCADQQ